MTISSWLAYFFFCIAVHFWNFFNSFASMDVSFLSGRFWLNFLLVVGFCGIIDFTSFSFDFLFGGYLTSSLQRLIKEHGTLNNKADLPEDVMKYVNQFEKMTVTKKKKGEEVKKEVHFDARIDGKPL